MFRHDRLCLPSIPPVHQNTEGEYIT
jgi:hypothetical protein